MFCYSIANIGNKGSHQVFCEIAFLKNFANFTGNTTNTPVFLFNGGAGLHLSVELFGKRAPLSKFSDEFDKNIWKTYSIEHLRSVVYCWDCIQRK